MSGFAAKLTPLSIAASFSLLGALFRQYKE